MNQIAILSDIHANLRAFKAVLKEIESKGIKKIYFLGDTFDNSPHASACMKLVRELGGNSVIGNMEAEFQVRFYTFGEFGDEEEANAKWASELPSCEEIHEAWMAHAGLDNPLRFHYMNTLSDAMPTLEILERSESNVGFFGHTHAPVIFTKNAGSAEMLYSDFIEIPRDTACAITVGSVGKPDTPGDRRASWVTWNPAKRTVRFHKTKF